MIFSEYNFLENMVLPEISEIFYFYFHSIFLKAGSEILMEANKVQNFYF